MHIFLCGSKAFYDRIPAIKHTLEQSGHIIMPPNGYDAPEQEASQKVVGDHAAWKAAMLRADRECVMANDAILVLNYDKNGQHNYVGGAVFLEIAHAFTLHKKIFFMNPIPDNIFTDELIGMQPVIINGDLLKVH